MNYLLDTNALSDSRRAALASPGFRAWLEEQPLDALYISAITLMEAEIGTLRVQRRDPPQGALLRAWIDDIVLPRFDMRILPVTAEIALRAAALQVPDPLATADCLIAATALVNGMSLVTRNARHFGRTGVSLVNPW